VVHWHSRAQPQDKDSNSELVVVEGYNLPDVESAKEKAAINKKPMAERKSSKAKVNIYIYIYRDPFVVIRELNKLN
jgi:hypothetical protein